MESTAGSPTPTPDFKGICNGSMPRVIPTEQPKKPDNPRALAIDQMVLAFESLEDRLQHVTAIFQPPITGTAPAQDQHAQSSIENVLLELGAIAHAPPHTGWKDDLRVLIKRASAAREVFDLLLFSRHASPHSFALLGLPTLIASMEQIAHFADEVKRIETALFAPVAEYVLSYPDREEGLNESSAIE